MTGSDLVGMEYEPLYPFLSELNKNDEKLSNAHKVYAADFVTTEDGTGIVHTAVMYGADDFELGTKVGLPKFHLVNDEGKFIQGTGFIEGRYVREADENGKPTLAVDIIDDLKKRNLFFKQENIKHSYPHCWRCDTPLVYYARTSWYFGMSKLREKLLKANEAVNWEPGHIKKGRFGEWLDGIKDWAISRERYWGTPIPVWEDVNGGKVVIDSVETLKKYSKKSGNRYFLMRHGESEHNPQTLWSVIINAKFDKLTEQGKTQASGAVHDFKEKIDIIIASPYRRGQETAQIAAQILGIPAESVITDPRIGEWNVGSDYEGKPMDTYFQVRNKSTDRYNFKETDGESYADVFTRSGSFIYEVESKYQGKNILIVTHGGAARAIEFVAKGFAYDTLFESTREYRNFNNAEIREVPFVPLPHNDRYELDLHKPYIDEAQLENNGMPLSRTKEVMDVWFDSGAMPYAQDHVFGHPVNFSPVPADYISEAIDQTRGWFYTLHAVSNLVSDDARAAYKNVICLGHILDGEGRKMSKSKGNVVDPWEMFAKYGADTVRFWMYSVNAPGDSKNFDEKTVKEVENKVFNLLGNVLSFYELYRDRELEQHGASLNHVLDQWIVARLNELISICTERLDAFDLFKPSRAIRDFIDDFSTWYLRRSRDRIKDEDVGAKTTLYHVLKNMALLLAPFAPYTAEDMWQKLKSDTDEESVHLASWPKAEGCDKQAIEEMQQVREICTTGNSLRKKENIPVRQPLQTLKVADLKLDDKYLELIKEELNVKQVVSGSETTLDTAITSELKAEGNYRELIRGVQDLRKAQGLKPGDVVSLTVSPIAESFVSPFLEDFKKTVQASNVSFAENEGETVSIDDMVLRVTIKE
jgi:isoleucyl-tRNA synthetase